MSSFTPLNTSIKKSSSSASTNSVTELDCHEPGSKLLPPSHRNPLHQIENSPPNKRFGIADDCPVPVQPPQNSTNGGPTAQQTLYKDACTGPCSNTQAELPGLKKRQRRFTTRTKTGCLTCRKRKKKCDEGRPICFNCHRGNYLCAGYSQPKRRGQIAGENPNPPANSPKGIDSISQPILPREVPQTDVRHPDVEPHIIAGTALAHMAAERDARWQAVPYMPKQLTHKEEMLAGRGYYYHDPELTSERDRTAVSCRLFNTLVQGHVPGDERRRLFLEIILAGRLPISSQGPPGYSQLYVEAPFFCDYGYNIHIGRNVTIRRNCSFNDAGQISIGDNCTIGPNVCIYTEEMYTDPEYRQEYPSTHFGKGVIIDANCWIGGSVTVLPGKIVGKGATVIAGSVVSEDVPPFAIVCGNPARVTGRVHTQ